MRLKNITNLLLLSGVVAFTSCGAGGDDPGTEYAPQMYHSVPYEPLSQITEEDIPDGFLERNYYITNSSPYNDYNGKLDMNMKKPVEGTVARQNYSNVTGSTEAKADQPLLYYRNIGRNDIEYSASNLENPLEDSKDVVDEGKHLYEAYCLHCHGTDGDGKGKVAQKYAGVANFKSKSILNATDGHIFHVITHGKGAMWPHGSQVNPEERWKIVKYVRKLQGK